MHYSKVACKIKISFITTFLYILMFFSIQLVTRRAWIFFTGKLNIFLRSSYICGLASSHQLPHYSGVDPMSVQLAEHINNHPLITGALLNSPSHIPALGAAYLQDNWP